MLEMRQVFAIFDTSGDGDASIEEFAKALRRFAHMEDEEIIALAMKPSNPHPNGRKSSRWR